MNKPIAHCYPGVMIQLPIAIPLMNTDTSWLWLSCDSAAHRYPLFFAYECRYMMVMVYLMVQLFIGIIIENVEVRKDGREEAEEQIVL